MKAVLYCANRPGRDTHIVALADIMADDPPMPVTMRAPSWAVFPHHATIYASLDEGMLYPVPVLRHGNILRFAGGGLRLSYAVARGYTHIEAAVVDHYDDAEALMVISRRWNIERGIPL